MAATLKDLARNLFTPDDGEASSASALDDHQLAAAVLMVEVARADFSEDAVEQAAVAEELHKAFGLNDEQVRRLTEAAGERADESVSLHRYVKVINDTLSYDEKLDVLLMLWRVAYADGELDKHEEHLMRRYADLLYVPHRDWVQLKLKAAPDA